MWGEVLYLSRVEDTIRRLRARCLGQDTALADILPGYLRQVPEEQRVAQLADQLLYALAAVSRNVSREELARSREWLYGCILYLMVKCPPADQTLLGVRTVLESSEIERQMLMNGIKEQLPSPPEGPLPGILTDRLDAATVRLLTSLGRMEKPKELHTKLACALDGEGPPG